MDKHKDNSKSEAPQIIERDFTTDNYVAPPKPKK